ncbi:hypothetical protein E4K67_12645 [Desulfosporosinus fructosivorans]|uniref:Uncharacterized protein n=1 Tax=Desulfosporosinus fructosivorans TaxID=2018669 RepID=A0A4Z0R3G9_9FIRM|nr:hypothetical protein E4K67_12645 [Desulfosporosinus fructosivorans]
MQVSRTVPRTCMFATFLTLLPSLELRTYKSEPSLIEQLIKLDSGVLSYRGGGQGCTPPATGHGCPICRNTCVSPRPLTSKLLSLNLISESKQVRVVSAKFPAHHEINVVLSTYLRKNA